LTKQRSSLVPTECSATLFEHGCAPLMDTS
jgi:hypothetical protein